MPLSKTLMTAAVALIVGAVAVTSHAQDVTITPDPALAGLGVEEAVAKRQELMKANGGRFRRIDTLSGADAIAAAEMLIANFSSLTVLFPEGSDRIAGTEALPSIWQNWDAFQGLFVQSVGFATELKAAAEAGDAAAYAAAARSLGGTCGACHEQFRI